MRIFPRAPSGKSTEPCAVPVISLARAPSEIGLGGRWAPAALAPDLWSVFSPVARSAGGGCCATTGHVAQRAIADASATASCFIHDSWLELHGGATRIQSTGSPPQLDLLFQDVSD